MNQYTAKNRAFILQQMPTATEVHPFSYWQEVGRRVKKGEKALRVWLPKNKRAAVTEGIEVNTTYFVRAPVFDISQTESKEEYEARKSAA